MTEISDTAIGSFVESKMCDWPGDLQRRFPSEVLKVPPGFFLLLVVKCERRERN